MLFLRSVGQKFPSKTLEASLNATVHFGEKRQQGADSQSAGVGFVEDPFCTGINSYAQVIKTAFRKTFRKCPFHFCARNSFLFVLVIHF